VRCSSSESSTYNPVACSCPTSAALRQVGAAEADVVAQCVFVDLARKSRHLAGKEASLAGWLLRATRLASLHQMRTQRRRTANETRRYEPAHHEHFCIA
jgi:DNA-directed RNA polymerase specialized sigma24 family protein